MCDGNGRKIKIGCDTMISIFYFDERESVIYEMSVLWERGEPGY